MTIFFAFCRTTFLVFMACIMLVRINGSAQADEQYPTRTITMVVPFAAGGPTDILGRIIAQAIGPSLGKQVIVEDTTGAGGTIGATRAARAAPDGYMMVMGNLGTHAASVGIYKSLPYDPRRDFEPVILVASTPMVLLTRKTLPVHTLNDVITWAKANKGNATMGSAGVGSISHLTLLLFNHLTGADLIHVPYRGLSEATNDLLGGQIDMLFDQVVTAAPHISTTAKMPSWSRFRIGPIRSRTCRRRTRPAYRSCRPSRGPHCSCPKARQDRLSTASTRPYKRPCRIPRVMQRLADIGADLPPVDLRSPQALGRLVNAEIDKWVPLIQAAGVVAP